jgi:hypothetical protein
MAAAWLQNNPEMLARRFRIVALINLAISPFLMAFLLMFFFMRNAEKFYHHPRSLALAASIVEAKL